MAEEPILVYGSLDQLIAAGFSGLQVRVGADGHFLSDPTAPWSDQDFQSFFKVPPKFLSKKPVKARVFIAPIFPNQQLKDEDEGYALLTFNPMRQDDDGSYPLFYPSDAFSSFVGKPNELNEKLSEYKDVKELGQGSFGKVKLVEDQQGKLWALKEVDLSKFCQNKPRSEAEMEPTLQQSLQHPNIVQVKEYFVTDENLYIVLEYANRGSLLGYIKEVKKSASLLQAPEILHLFTQCCQAVQHMHARGIVHRDLKPDNFMMHQESEASALTAKLADFGTAKKNDAMSTMLGTPAYIAPEIIQNAGNYAYTNKVDVWSLGCMLYEMFEGVTPFYGNGQVYDIQQRILSGAYEKPKNPSCTQVYVDLIKNMLQLEVENRFDIDAVMDVLLAEYFDMKMRENVVSATQSSMASDLKQFRSTQKEISKTLQDKKVAFTEKTKAEKELQKQQDELEILLKQQYELEAQLAREQQQEQLLSKELTEMQTTRNEAIKLKKQVEGIIQQNKNESEKLQKLYVQQKRDQLLFFNFQYKLQQELSVSHPKAIQDIFSVRLIEIVYKSIVFVPENKNTPHDQVCAQVKQTAIRFATSYSKKDIEGVSYVTEFQNSQPHGYGMAKLTIGTYFGFLESGQQSGFGNMTYEGGDVYEGAWRRGRRCGVGKLTKMNGDVYNGVWREDLFWGEGTYWHAGTGVAQAGRWEQGQFRGE